jgi:hypothetical protein
MTWCLVKHGDNITFTFTMKTYRGSGGIFACILNLSTRRKECPCSCPRDFNPEKQPPIHIEQEEGWAPEPVWTWWQREKFLSLAWN